MIFTLREVCLDFLSPSNPIRRSTYFAVFLLNINHNINLQLEPLMKIVAKGDVVSVNYYSTS